MANTNILKLQNNTARIETLTNWLNNQGQWISDYQTHEDNINNYAELFEGGNLHYGEIDNELEKKVKETLETMDNYDILELCDAPFYHHGFGRCSNEIWSINIGEVESQFSGIYDHETKSNCVFTDLCKGLTIKEIEQAKSNCEYFINGDSIYLDCSYDRVSICLNIEKFETYCKNKI